jgi:hypothetical protein
MKRPFFLFVELPEGGGGAFHRILRHNFGDRLWRETNLLPEPRYRPDQIRAILAAHPGLDAALSARFSFELPFDEPDAPRDLRALAFARDPIERELALHLAARPSAEATPAALAAHFEKLADSPARPGQLAALVGDAGLPRLQQLAAAGQAWVLPWRRQDDALIWLETAFPDFFRDCAYDFALPGSPASAAPEAVRELLRRQRGDDLDLCRWAEDDLDARLAQLFPDPEELARRRADFAARRERLTRLRGPAGPRRPLTGSEEEVRTRNPLVAPESPSLWRTLFPRPVQLPPAPAAADAARVFVFAHIPKCGGKTFSSILQRNFGNTYYREEALYTAYKYPRDEVSVILNNRFTLRCLSSHRLTFDLPWTESPRPLLGITFVRDPVERALSNYFFQRGHARLNTAAKHQTVEEFLLAKLEETKDFQTYFLTRGQLDLGRIRELLERGWAHVFPLERFDDVILCLERAYPLDFRDGSYQVLNQAERDAPLDPKLRQRLIEGTPLDAELVALSRQHLDQLLARLFPGGQGLEEARRDLDRRKALRAAGTAEKEILPVA